MTYPSIIPDMPEAEYHARPEVSKHDLDMIRRAPLLYWHKKANPDAASDEMNFGSLVHLAVLQPDLLESSVAFLPDDAPSRVSDRNRNAKKPSETTLEAIAWWDDWNAKTEGKQIVKPEAYERVLGIQKSLMRNPATAQFIEMEGMREASFFYELHGVKCRSRMDFSGQGIIWDLKTCGDASASGFAKEIGSGGYHRQGALYLDAAKACDRPAKKFVFVTVEKTAPFLCSFHILGNVSIDTARIENRRNLETYKRCLESGIWPNMAAPFDGEEIECPLWAL